MDRILADCVRAREMMKLYYMKPVARQFTWIYLRDKFDIFTQCAYITYYNWILYNIIHM